MATHNICIYNEADIYNEVDIYNEADIYNEVDKKYARCNLKTTNLLDCALTGVCAVIRSNMVIFYSSMKTYVVGLNRSIRGEINKYIRTFFSWKKCFIGKDVYTQSAFYVNLYRAVIGPSG